MEDFIEKFKEQFEDVDTVKIHGGTQFKTLDTWDSLTAFSVQSMIDDEYSVKVSSQDLKDCDTVEELFQLIKSRQ